MNNNEVSDNNMADNDLSVYTCCGEIPCGGCGCRCSFCMDGDVSLEDENRESYSGEGGSDICIHSEPKDIPNGHRHDLSLQRSVQDDHYIGPENNSYEAPQPLTFENINQVNWHSHNENDRQRWLQRHWIEVDEYPNRAFLSAVDDQRFDHAGPIERDSPGESMEVDNPTSHEGLSGRSGITVSFSRSSHSAGAFVRGTGMFTALGYMHSPLRLL